MSEIDLKSFFLEQVRLFENFPADKVEEIVIKSRLATYEGNEAILETGDEYRFWAEDAAHAREQAVDAEPEYEITEVVLGQKGSLL